MGFAGIAITKLLGKEKLKITQKYQNKIVIVDGIKFDSKKEAVRYNELKLLEKAGEISGLRRQVKFELIPAQREPDTIGKRGGVKPGKVIERAICYYADYVYIQNGETVVEDVKGFRTPVYKIKKALMLYIHGIRIKEV